MPAERSTTSARCSPKTKQSDMLCIRSTDETSPACAFCARMQGFVFLVCHSLPLSLICPRSFFFGPEDRLSAWSEILIFERRERLIQLKRKQYHTSALRELADRLRGRCALRPQNLIRTMPTEGFCQNRCGNGRWSCFRFLFWKEGVRRRLKRACFGQPDCPPAPVFAQIYFRSGTHEQAKICLILFILPPQSRDGFFLSAGPSFIGGSCPQHTGSAVR